nr:LCP family protein [Spelaeicoccus albus]
MMLVHIDADHENAYAISFPRDLWVPVDGHGHQKINAALAFGGLPLAAKTVEELTHVRLDHVAMIDFKGFAKMTDALGGVTVDVPKTFTSRGVSFTKGPQKLDGKEALVFVRERHAFRDGDFQRMRDQQSFLKALLDKTLSRDTLSSLSKTEDLVSTVAPYLTVDRDFTTVQMAKLGWSMRGIRSSDITFITAPNLGTGRAGAASIVKLDEPGMNKLGKALSNDSMGDYLAKNS